MEERHVEHCPFCNANLIVEFQEKNEVKYGRKLVFITENSIGLRTFNALFVRGYGRENKEIGELFVFKEVRKRYSETPIKRKFLLINTNVYSLLMTFILY